MIVFRWLFFLLKVLWVILVYASKLLALVARSVKQDFRAEGAYGTARWASGWEKFRHGIYRGSGPVIGKGSFGRLIRFNRDGIVQVFARNGAGKGLGIVVPTLLDYPGSMLVTDVKGENYALTAAWRAKKGQRVLKLDPFDLNHSARFNPLDSIRKGTDQESDDARALANLMVVRDSPDAHWSDRSTSMISAFILDALHQPDPVNRTLAYVRKRSTGGGGAGLKERIEDIAHNSPSALAQTIALGFLDTMGDEKKMPEFTSILSDMQKATEVWAEGTPAGTLSSRSTFRLEDLNDPDQVTTLYICLDEEKLESYTRWLRVMTGLTINAMTRAKRTGRPKHKVVLLLDEARALGRLDPLVNAIGYLRAYCTPVLIWQNMSQVRAIYGKSADEFLANASCRVFFGIDDNPTAEEVSKMCGQKPILSRSQNISQPSDAWLKENRSQGESEGGYWLIDPAEVQRLPDTTVIAKMRPVPYPMLISRMDYRKRLRWLGRYGEWKAGGEPPVAAEEPKEPPPPPLKAAPPVAPVVEDEEPLPPPPPRFREAPAEQPKV